MLLSSVTKKKENQVCVCMSGCSVVGVIEGMRDKNNIALVIKASSRAISVCN